MFYYILGILFWYSNIWRQWRPCFTICVLACPDNISVLVHIRSWWLSLMSMTIGHALQSDCTTPAFLRMSPVGHLWSQSEPLIWMKGKTEQYSTACWGLIQVESTYVRLKTAMNFTYVRLRTAMNFTFGLKYKNADRICNSTIINLGSACIRSLHPGSQYWAGALSPSATVFWTIQPDSCGYRSRASSFVGNRRSDHYSHRRQWQQTSVCKARQRNHHSHHRGRCSPLCFHYVPSFRF